MKHWQKILEVCNLPIEERHKIGDKAKKFIAEYKNPKTMTKRIVVMWKQLLEKE